MFIQLCTLVLERIHWPGDFSSHRCGRWSRHRRRPSPGSGRRDPQQQATSSQLQCTASCCCCCCCRCCCCVSLLRVVTCYVQWVACVLLLVESLKWNGYLNLSLLKIAIWVQQQQQHGVILSSDMWKIWDVQLNRIAVLIWHLTSRKWNTIALVLMFRRREILSYWITMKFNSNLLGTSLSTRQ